MSWKIETGDDNPVLRTPSESVRPAEFSKFRTLSETMVKYVKNGDNGSVGLAAPQIGVGKRIIAVSLLWNYDDEAYRTVAMFNPEILGASEILETDSEGCLSVPGKRGNVARPKRIRVRYADAWWRTYQLDLSGLAARIVLHEVDHLDGILFTDKTVGEVETEESAPVLNSET